MDAPRARPISGCGNLLAWNRLARCGISGLKLRWLTTQTLSAVPGIAAAAARVAAIFTASCTTPLSVIAVPCSLLNRGRCGDRSGASPVPAGMEVTMVVFATLDVSHDQTAVCVIGQDGGRVPTILICGEPPRAATLMTGRFTLISQVYPLKLNGRIPPFVTTAASGGRHIAATPVPEENLRVQTFVPPSWQRRRRQDRTRARGCQPSR